MAVSKATKNQVKTGVWETVRIRNDEGKTVEAIAPLIISASRSTDIPALYSDWLMNRLKRGFIKWKSPYSGADQYVSFKNTRLIVFWSKNPKPIIKHLSEIDKMGIGYYFHYTLNNYERENLETGVPPLKNRVATFHTLSRKVGKEKVIWRFDPLILANNIPIPTLVDRIVELGAMLRPYTQRLVFSYADIDTYRKVRENLKRYNISHIEWDMSAMRRFALELTSAIRHWGVEIATCAEQIDLQEFGIRKNQCVDPALISYLFNNDNKLMDFLGYQLVKNGLRPIAPTESHLKKLKDRGQRKECGCIASKDIGMYNTCGHLCKYCYANCSEKVVKKNTTAHDGKSAGIVP